MERSRVSLTDCTVENNVGVGVSGRTVRLKRSTVTGNGVGQSNCEGFPGVACTDLWTNGRPVVRDSTCGTSWDPINRRTWGVCSND